VLIDCLVFAVGADTNSGQVTIDTIRRIKAELGVNFTLGASNISFGLPDRDLINNAFVSIVIASGVTSLIVDVARVRPIVMAVDLILARDRYARRYVEEYRRRQTG
jgi:5-methyltetrahydrofolate--homocysteine methyltransferase